MAGDNKEMTVVLLERRGVTSDGDLVNCVRIYGLSTSTKPTTGIANSSEFVEMDGGALYYYSASTDDWVEFAA